MNNRVIVSLHNRVNDTIQIGGKSFTLDSVFRPLWNAVQFGNVVACDESCDLVPGDKVYMHHFVLEKEHILPVDDNKMSWLEYNQIFCRVREDGIKVLGEYILVEPMRYSHPMIKKEMAGLTMTTKSDNDEVERIGIVSHVSDSGIRVGIKEGDVILFGRNCEYDIVIENKRYYKMHMGDIISILGNDVKISSIK